MRFFCWYFFYIFIFPYEIPHCIQNSRPKFRFSRKLQSKIANHSLQRASQKVGWTIQPLYQAFVSKRLPYYVAYETHFLPLKISPKTTERPINRRSLKGGVLLVCGVSVISPVTFIPVPLEVLEVVLLLIFCAILFSHMKYCTVSRIAG